MECGQELLVRCRGRVAGFLVSMASTLALALA
jgi:hypothetical protein